MLIGKTYWKNIALPNILYGLEAVLLFIRSRAFSEAEAKRSVLCEGCVTPSFRRSVTLSHPP